MAETFNVVVEIPRGSKNKYEVDHETGRAWQKWSTVRRDRASRTQRQGDRKSVV